LEASASRRAAYKAYQEYRSKFFSSTDDDTLHKNAIDFAQQVEMESFNRLNLSIQELLDCDTTADQGCTGGNPLLSFYFIHRFGLTSWDKYPYVGYADKCKSNLIKLPVATVKSWGIISPNHENHMELVLRYIGPIAVGVNGASSSFLSYSGGIYDKPDCKQGANHALLITGYGQEKHRDGTIVRYWIARNSWGTGWGEHGFVRVRRGEGSKGIPGVCGIARSASVALGGILLERQASLLPYNVYGLRGNNTDDYPFQGLCADMGFEPESACGRVANWIDFNMALTLGLLGVFCALLAIWPLTSDCRRRRRQRRRREFKRQQGLDRQHVIKRQQGLDSQHMIARQRQVEQPSADHSDAEWEPILVQPEQEGVEYQPDEESSLLFKNDDRGNLRTYTLFSSDSSK
jgi:Papain family cysteine protease